MGTDSKEKPFKHKKSGLICAYKAAYYMKGYFLGTKLSYVKSSK